VTGGDLNENDEMVCIDLSTLHNKVESIIYRRIDKPVEIKEKVVYAPLVGKWINHGAIYGVNVEGVFKFTKEVTNSNENVKTDET
jgi:hypothetical protein